MNWSLTFSPLLPWPWLAGLGVVALLLTVPGLLRRMRGAWLRLAAAAALLLALSNPVLLNEQREPLSTVVAMVVDHSASQGLDGRDKMTAQAADELAKRLGAFHNIEVRRIDAGGSAGGQPVDGTNLFGPLSTALADVPPDRIGAVIMLTDGEVHDIPASKAGLPPNAPLHVLLSGHAGETDRRIVIDSAPRFGIVNESPSDQVPRRRRRRHRRRPAGHRVGQHRRRATVDAEGAARRAQPVRSSTSPMADPTSSSSRRSRSRAS